MKHYLILKYNDKVKDKNKMNLEVKKVFDQILSIKGITKVKYKKNVTDYDNRYDFMVVMYMKNKEALKNYDVSDLHHSWKENYTKYLESKCVIDC